MPSTKVKKDFFSFGRFKLNVPVKLFVVIYFGLIMVFFPAIPPTWRLMEHKPSFNARGKTEKDAIGYIHLIELTCNGERVASFRKNRKLYSYC